MPDYRKLHNGHGNSQTLAALSDYDFRVWNQYRASADDFGVCPLSAAKLQGDNRRLAADPASKVLKAIGRLIEAELVLVFNHQGQDYLCQANWQDFEDIRYPRQSLHPVPSAAVFGLLTAKTAELFREHRRKDSGKFPHLACAGTRETLTLTLPLTKTPTETDVEESPEPENAWTRIVDALAADCGAHSIAVWFRPCRLIGEYPDALRVAVPSKIFLEWIPKHYSRALAEVCERVVPGKVVRLELAERKAS